MKVSTLIISTALLVALLVGAPGCSTQINSPASAEPAKSNGFIIRIVYVGAEAGRARYIAAYASPDREEELVAWYNGMEMHPEYFRVALLNSREVARLRDYLESPEQVASRKPLNGNIFDPHFELRVHDFDERYRLDIGPDLKALPALKKIEALLDPQTRFPVSRIIQRIENAGKTAS